MQSIQSKLASSLLEHSANRTRTEYMFLTWLVAANTRRHAREVEVFISMRHKRNTVFKSCTR